MARQLDCALIGMMYILDEPSIGLHPRDIDKLIELLRDLRDKGNSVFVVEHDPAVIYAADHVVEIGPAAGTGGGQVCFNGPIEDFLTSDSMTAQMLRTFEPETHPQHRSWSDTWPVRGAQANNLQSADVDIPKHVLVAITGVAGSGKSSLIHAEFVPLHPEAIVVDQTAIGRSSRSNPVTYLGLFDRIRKLFAQATGEPAGLFSFNSTGACRNCKGKGYVSIEMSFLDDVKQECSTCRGRRYTDDVLTLTCNDLNIHEVLSLTATDALEELGKERAFAELGDPDIDIAGRSRDELVAMAVA